MGEIRGHNARVVLDPCKSPPNVSHAYVVVVMGKWLETSAESRQTSLAAVSMMVWGHNLPGTIFVPSLAR
jgi:hypothetical protein